ncbi:hypothetical protein V2J09_008141 [Rumex salicifolius]
MVARNFFIHHEDSNFDVEYDPEDGLEVFKFQLFSITAIPPDQQKIVGVDDDRIVSDDSDLTSICDRLRVIEINDDEGEKQVEPSCSNDQLAAELMKSDEEFARMLQIVGVDDNRIVSDDSDLTSIYDRLRVIEINDDEGEKQVEPSCSNDQLAAELMKSDEEFPRMLQIVGVDDDRIVSDDSDLTSICDRLRVIEINDDEGEKQVEPSCSNDQLTAELMKSDEEFARMLQAEEEALLLQQYVANEDMGQMEHRIRPYIDQVLMYEDPVRQVTARKTVNKDALEEKTMVSLAKEGNFAPTKAEIDHAFLVELLYWFKKSFSWVNAPPCKSCGKETIGQGMGGPLPSEIQYGGLRVELYRCKCCSRITRFPRYNDPMKELLETREGRCGEWANCFTLYCRAFGYESRLILDLTDHVWTECFSDLLGRWIHLDPCEGSYDKPLLYEKGWKKNLNYVIAISKDGVYDVTKRYTRKWAEVLTRRNIVRESSLDTLLANLTKECRSRGFASELLTMLEVRDRNEIESIQRDMYSEDNTSSLSLPGRQSGDKEWRISRSEYGSGENDSSNSTSCPIRLCVDEHVTQIYNAFGPILSKFVDMSLPASRINDVLNVMKTIMIDLRNLPFKSRRAKVKSEEDLTHFFVHEMLPAFDELLTALHLKFELVTNDVSVCLADDPVRTSLALPVVIDALDYLLESIGSSSSISRDSLSWPLLRLNRLHSGSTLASGEEPPLGIATSAFDGTRESKWEEPNGAKGCWIVYKLPDKMMHELVAYEIMSANDVPERDPKDWVVEGSEDGISNWLILDKQTNQMFDGRFQRKIYIIESNGILSNIFRFKFLSVRDGYTNSRLQLGCIDLYAKDK